MAVEAANWSDTSTAAQAKVAKPTIQALAFAFVAFVIVWSLYFAISESQSAIHNDMAEAYAWGKEYQLGYHQHPPFWSWLCGLWFAVMPKAGWSFAIMSSLNAALGLAGSWALIGRFAQGEKRIAATALLMLTPFYTFLSYKYNANSIFLSLWPWTTYFFVRSIDEESLGDAALCGLFLGFSFLSKYYAGVLAVTLALAALTHPARWRYLRSPAPWLSAAVALVLFAPHLAWLYATGAPPLEYLETVSGRGWGETLFFTFSALAGSLAQLAVAAAAVAFAAWRARREPRSPRMAPSRLNLLAVLVAAPPLLSALVSIALRNKISANMMIAIYSLAPLLLIECFGARGVPALARLATRLGAGIAIAALALSPAIALGKVWFGHTSEDTAPRKELAAEATRIWHDNVGRPIGFVGGSFGYDNAVVFYSPDHPHAFVHFDYFGAGWATPERVADEGLLSVCLADDPVCLKETANFLTDKAKRVELTLAHRAFGHSAKPVNFVVTTIPPLGPK